MKQYGFRWPAALDCDYLPKMSEQEKTGVICAAPPDLPNTSLNDNDIKNDKPFLTIDDNTLFTPHIVGIDLIEAKCECKCARPFFTINEFNNDKQTNLSHYYQQQLHQYQIQNVSNCAYACYSEAIYLNQNRSFINKWILIW